MPNAVSSFPSPCFSHLAHNGLNSGSLFSPKKLTALQMVTQYTPPVPVTQNLSFPLLGGGNHPGRGEREGWEPVVSHGCPKHHFGHIRGVIPPTVRASSSVPICSVLSPGTACRMDFDELEHAGEE